MKQILHEATHFVRVEHQKFRSWELNKKTVFLFLLSWTLTEGSIDKKISNLKMQDQVLSNIKCITRRGY